MRVSAGGNCALKNKRTKVKEATMKNARAHAFALHQKADKTNPAASINGDSSRYNNLAHAPLEGLELVNCAPEQPNMFHFA